MVQVIAGALKGVPEERRPEGLDTACLILGEPDFIQALEHLLAAVPRRFDHPWHEIIRQQVGKAVYSKITAGLEIKQPLQVAETQTSYSVANKKMIQMGLFD